MVPLDAGATIRPAAQQDASRLAEILVFSKRMAYRDIFQDDYGSFVALQVLPLAQQFLCRQNLTGFFVYEEAGILKGLARWKEPKSGVAELLLLYVDPFFQRSGIGSALLLKFLQAARQAGAAWAKLWVLEKIRLPAAFTKRRGFPPPGPPKGKKGIRFFSWNTKKRSKKSRNQDSGSFSSFCTWARRFLCREERMRKTALTANMPARHAPAQKRECSTSPAKPSGRTSTSTLQNTWL